MRKLVRVASLSVFPDKLAFPMPQSWFYPVYLTTTKPEMHTPYVENRTFGIQRELAKGNVLEIRHVGNRAVQLWHNCNLQETNIFENGFLKDFQTAQNRLPINAADSFVNDFSNQVFRVRQPRRSLMLHSAPEEACLRCPPVPVTNPQAS